MNWGFSATLLTGAAVYGLAAASCSYLDSFGVIVTAMSIGDSRPSPAVRTNTRS
jgi:hypothetical protein